LVLRDDVGVSSGGVTEDEGLFGTEGWCPCIGCRKNRFTKVVCIRWKDRRLCLVLGKICGER